eukprot:CAMPEP_0197516634 /NCGR_PEP_ID=MMETSP1318-20131121/1522_1 /TAXON_ID=552666 /ORGANISM="Partenskyella glossopodia, Strain RCC365" /LENGTH=130 /DNA_ID=CAMNT_0043065509 /DNA_START=157 /DNA_END=549 /DNA_ORIENTATION=-
MKEVQTEQKKDAKTEAEKKLKKKLIAAKKKEFFADITWTEIRYTVKAFQGYTNDYFKMYPGYKLKWTRINQSVLESLFGAIGNNCSGGSRDFTAQGYTTGLAAVRIKRGVRQLKKGSNVEGDEDAVTTFI